MSHATRQCSRFTLQLKKLCVEAIWWLIRYLKGTKNKDYHVNPKSDLGLEVCVDTDFSGNWDKTAPEMDSDTAIYRHGYIITYKGTPITWKSQLQTEIELSRTESDYIGLSHALREAIAIMHILKEI